jgi:polyphosphate kinase
VPLNERIRFLGIFSNNLDEFFRVRVATLKRMNLIQDNANMHLELEPEKILEDIQLKVLSQQSEFYRIWSEIQDELKTQKIFLITEKELNKEQMEFARKFYDDELSINIIPLMIESIPNLPLLKDSAFYLAVVMSNKESALSRKFSLIEVPTRVMNRFVLLPSKPGEHHIILLEDLIRFNLPEIFSFFGYTQYESHILKVTRDAELDIDNDVFTTMIQKLEKGLKNRKKGKPVRLVYDKEMDPLLLEYLIRRMNISRKDSLIPGGRIHKFKHFMNFPDHVFKNKRKRSKPFNHPQLVGERVSDIIQQQDIMLHFPYHSFNSVIDLLRESAMDPDVLSIKLTCYRLAAQSKIVNALINAVRNGKQVTVLIELRARFDEEANIEWKERLEEEGAKVIIGLPNMKVHSKLCVIRKKKKKKIIQYGFVSTGNLNENTAQVYGDHCLLTSDKRIMDDINRMLNFIEFPDSKSYQLKNCKELIPSPVHLRSTLLKLINHEIKQAKQNKPAAITIKVNSFSDEEFSDKLTEAAKAGVKLDLIVRGIFCMYSENPKYKEPVKAISIVDEYLEHARVFVFHNAGKEKIFISSADLMVRNLDHRVEATCPIYDEHLKAEIKQILEIQLNDNVKARMLDNEQKNKYVTAAKSAKKIRSQIEIHKYLLNKTNPTT